MSTGGVGRGRRHGERDACLQGTLGVETGELEVAAPGPAAQGVEPAVWRAAAPGPAAQAVESEELLVEDDPPDSHHSD